MKAAIFLGKVPSTTTHTMIRPRHVVVQSCGGGLDGKQYGCIPTKVQTVNIPTTYVRNSESGSQEQKCGVFPVDEHLSCVLGCKLTIDDCSDKQVHSNHTVRRRPCPRHKPRKDQK